ncbi:Holliday junction resolvase RuvX [Candidatus Kaiserbacteria bacterium CG10_big_fil_rev_8_21_14_0_10_51_14]|uniref:Putative pre-16S rRNA nuclease n=1 Tax=Candidatus Kaiserbacteria bacterium CG10_big_fil_rev_8_21_14_0_10_51_14 TaxID=1974610 RepID=A0A2H0UEP2_9BACT|nr:MAG: Holliday junction resolvase RuvX [Candidatus Kaiserbacteria bacterium CG10_big_fil_rev_8_21_14_0_10_51_14]
MKYLGIDYGAKRVGVAISDADGKIAFPRTVFQNNEKLFSQLKQLAVDEHIEAIIVGDTRAFAGLENPITKDAEVFVEELKKTLALPVTLASEAGSSIEASRYAEKRNEHDDSAAAAIILQRYLDMHLNAVE